MKYIFNYLISKLKTMINICDDNLNINTYFDVLLF